MSQLERQIDALYQEPLADFTASRTALAKTLSGEAARRVRALKKPAAVPWAVNQVFWRARPTYDRLLKLGRALRLAQVAALERKSKNRPDVGAASDAHRRAVTDAVHRAVQLASETGVKPNAEALARMFEALSVAATPSSESGRLTEVVAPSGFEALAGVTPAVTQRRHAAPAADANDTHEPASSSRTNPAAARRRGQEERRQAKHAEAELRKATHALDSARERADAARRALERAEAEVAAAERGVADARQAAIHQDTED